MILSPTGTASSVSLVHEFVFSSLYDVLMVHANLGYARGSIRYFCLSCDPNINDEKHSISEIILLDIYQRNLMSH
jgi:hypothetical protein